MATLTIDSVTINADGRTAVIKVLSTTAGGTYLFDSANAELTDLTTAKVVFTVVSKGYTGSTLGTITRTVYGDVVSRHSGVEPSGHGSWEADEDVSGSDLLITIALHEPIYQKDNTGVGNSGTAPVVRILANWYTKGADATGDTGASFAVTNNSTLAYFEPFGQWDGLPYERHTSDPLIGFSARHCHAIAAVVITATGVTSTNVVASGDITTQSRRQRPVAGFYGNAYSYTASMSSLTQGETVNLRAIAYPTVGDTPLDTDNYTVAGGYSIAEGRGPRTFICDKSNTIRTYACVDSVNGTAGGTASTTLATAEGDPFQTILQATNAGADHIYLVDTGPHLCADRSSNLSAAFSITIEPHPNQSGTVVVTRSSTFSPLRIAPVKWKNVTLRMLANNVMWDGSTNGTALIFESVTFDANGFTLAEHHYNFDGIYYKDCTFDNMASWKTTSSGGDEFRFWFDGCKQTTDTAQQIRSWFRIVCCDFPKIYTLWSHAGNSAELPRNLMWESSRHLKMENFHDWTSEIDAARTGFSICGNIVECDTSAMAGSPLISLVEPTQQTINHATFAHNTFVGQRTNHFYDDGAAPQTSIGIKQVGNILHQWNAAQDLYHNTGPYTGREGRWWVGFGTQTYAVVTQNITATTRRAYVGIGSPPDGTSATFVNDQTGATGGGDYSLAVGSVGRGILPAGTRVLAYDLFGTAIPDDGTGHAGAIQTVPVGLHFANRVARRALIRR